MKEPAVDPEKARAIIEAILLTATDPVTPGRLVDLLDGLNGRDIRQAIDTLNELYARQGHGLTIVEVGGGFQLATRQELAPWLRKFHQDRTQVRLSQAAMETLAIVAFKQPITRVEVDSIRGVNSVGVLQTLMELSMVRIVGRSDGIGKPMLFGTTREFLIHFGLRTLADLPKPKELEELLAEGEKAAGDRAQLALALAEEGRVARHEQTARSEEGDQSSEERRGGSPEEDELAMEKDRTGDFPVDDLQPEDESGDLPEEEAPSPADDGTGDLPADDLRPEDESGDLPEEEAPSPADDGTGDLPADKPRPEDQTAEGADTDIPQADPAGEADTQTTDSLRSRKGRRRTGNR